MKLHDPFARLSHDTARRFRLRGTRPLRAHRRARVPGSARGAALSARTRDREARSLAVIDSALTADAPLLSARYGLFNQLSAAEGPVTGERLPVPPGPRARRGYVVVMLALAVLAGLCVALSTQPHPARQCVAAPAGSVGTSVAYAQEHGVACPAYPVHQ